MRVSELGLLYLILKN